MKKSMKLLLGLGVISTITLPLTTIACNNPTPKKDDNKKDDNTSTGDPKNTDDQNHKETPKEPTTNDNETDAEALEFKKQTKKGLYQVMIKRNAKKEVINDMSDVKAKFMDEFKDALLLDENKANELFADVKANPNDVSLIQPLLNKIKKVNPDQYTDEEIMSIVSSVSSSVYGSYYKIENITATDLITLVYELNDLYNQNKEEIFNKIFEFLGKLDVKEFPDNNDDIRKIFSRQWVATVVTNHPELVEIFKPLAAAKIYQKYNIDATKIANELFWNITTYYGRKVFE